MKRVATFALLAALAACSRSTTSAPAAPHGNVLTVVKALTSSINVTRVNVTIGATGADLTRDPVSGSFVGNLQVAAGPAQTVTATAYAGTNVVGSGSTVVDIVQNQTVSVHITILDTTSALPVPDHGPILTTVVVSPQNPSVGDTVTVSATAVDPDGDPITYEWTQQCNPATAAAGFANPAAPATTWSASEQATCSLVIRASSKNLSDTLGIGPIVVYPANQNVGSVGVTATFVEQPLINSISISGANGGSFYTTINRTDADATLRQPVRPGQILNFRVDDFMGSDGGGTQAVYRLSDNCGGTAMPGYSGQDFQWTAPTKNVVCVVTATKTVMGLVDSFPVALFLSGCADDQFEPNDTRQQAAWLPSSYGNVFGATGLIAANDDWFQANFPPQPQASTVKVFVSSATQLSVEIVDASGMVIGSGTNGASATIPSNISPNSYVHVKPPAAGACGTKYDLTILQEVGTPTISISPSMSTIASNSMQWFTPMVTGLPGGGMTGSYTWSLTGAGCGTLDSNTGYGVNYHAPGASVTGCRLSVTSTLDPSVSGFMDFSVVAPQITVTPPSAMVPVNGTQSFTAMAVGFPVSSGLYWYVSGMNCGSVWMDPMNPSNATYNAPPNPVSGCQVVASSGMYTGAADVTVVPPGPVSVSINSPPAAVLVSSSTWLNVSVANAMDQSVTWSVQEGAVCGSFDQWGNYMAPASPVPMPGSTTGPQSCHLVATSNADPTQSATVTVTVAQPTISGTVSYAGAAKGRVYIAWSWGTQPNTNPNGGWSLAAPGTFTIRTPLGMGQAVVWAWMDTLGTGRYSAGADPFGVATVMVNQNAITSSVGTITLVDPAPATPPVLPSAPVIGPGDGFAFVQIGQPPKTSSGFEVADHYTVYWSTTPGPGPSNFTGSFTFPAGSNRAIVRNLNNGDQLYFSATTIAGGLESAPKNAATGPVTIGPPAYGGAVAGTVNVPAFAGSIIVTASAGGSWYPVMFDNPAPGPLAYSIPVPDGTYGVTVFADVGSDGILGPSNPQMFNALTGVAVAGGVPTTVADLDLAAALGPAASVTTSYYSQWQSVSLNVQAAADTDPVVPARAVLLAANGIPFPIDLGLSSVVTGNKLTFTGFVNLQQGALPKVGDFYQVKVVYPDGTAKIVDAVVTGLVTDVPTPTSPVGSLAALPTQFTWSAPATLPAGTYSYNPGLWPNNNGWIWGPTVQSPATFANYGGPPLSGKTQYWWWVSVRDSFGNSGWSNQVTFTTP